MDSIRWGVLGTASIATETVIPAIIKAHNSVVEAIGSRREERAKSVAGKLGISKYYGSYDELLKDPDLDAVYIPLPNHLHVAWSIKALEAGKHVLCEKPIAMNADQSEELLHAAEMHSDLKVMEAFMYRHHPQWKKALEMVRNSKIGRLRTIETFFSYYNTDPDSILNRPEMGGGALMDIGCYAVSLSRYLFEREPVNMIARMKKDPHLKIDYLTSGLLDFEEGTSSFTCSTQVAPHQQVDIHGTEGRITLPLPFNPPTERPSRMFVHIGSDMQVVELPVCNQYTLQVELFSEAIRKDQPVSISLEESHANMKAIDRARRSAISKEHAETW